MISREKFIRIIDSARDFYKRLALIEEGLGVVSDKMSDFPALILDELEEESGRKWSVKLCDDIYSTKRDAGDIYDDILDLELTRPIKTDDIIQVIDLSDLKKLFKERHDGMLYFETDKNTFYWTDEFKQLCGKMYQVEKVYWDNSFCLRGVKNTIHLPAEFVRLIK